MSHPIPHDVLAELGATYAALLRHFQRTGAPASASLRLSIDKAGAVRLEPEGVKGITFRVLVAALDSEGQKPPA